MVRLRSGREVGVSAPNVQPQVRNPPPVRHSTPIEDPSQVGDLPQLIHPLETPYPHQLMYSIPTPPELPSPPRPHPTTSVSTLPCYWLPAPSPPSPTPPPSPPIKQEPSTPTAAPRTQEDDEVKKFFEAKRAGSDAEYRERHGRIDSERRGEGEEFARELEEKLGALKRKEEE